MVDSNALKVSFDTAGDSLSKVHRLSSKLHAIKRAFGFTKQTQRTGIHS